MILLWMAACAACAFGLTLLAVCLCAHRKRRAQTADCVIVLGARVRPDGSLSRTLRHRCEAAEEVWRRGDAARVIVCGGQGRDEPCSEASAMAAHLLGAGVPESAIFREDQSTNTQENLRFAREIMLRQGFSRAALVTSDYHLTRALWIARDQGVRACGVAAKGSDQPMHILKSRIQETMSWWLYLFRKINNKGGIS